MPPQIKITKEAILTESLHLVREKGAESLNARNLARRLGCSVHPIFRTFQSMSGLKEAVYRETLAIYNQTMLRALGQGDDGFLQMGLTYIDFAKTEKNLFKLLFMSDAFREQSIMDIVGHTEGDDTVLAVLCQAAGLNLAAARELYAGIWVTTHGIAALYATNNCRFSDQEVVRLLDNSFHGLILKLKA